MKPGKPLRRKAPIGRFGRRARREAQDAEDFDILVKTAALVSHSGKRIYECSRCKARVTEGWIVAHHIVRRSQAPEEWKHDPSNGVALCKPCHSEIHDGNPPDRGRWLKRAPQTIAPPHWYVDPEEKTP